MDELIRKIYGHLRETQLIPEGSYVIAGVSGGADSMCLLYVLMGLKDHLHLRLAAVHVNHQLRGEAALEDQHYVERICRENGIACFVFTGNVPAMARDRRLTEEEAGRLYRYECFEKVRASEQADLIAVAHNMEDVSETVLLNMARGSGLKGLGGIPEKRGRIVRPLLTVHRREIEAFDRRHHIAWRTDQTNLERSYARNRIRLDVLPYLEREINSRAAEHIAKASEAAAEASAYLEKQAALAGQQIVREIPDGVEIETDGFCRLDKALQRELLRQCIGRTAGRMKDIEAVHIDMMLALFTGSSGRQADLPYQLKAVRSYDTVRLFRAAPQAAENMEAAAITDFPASVSLPDGCRAVLRVFDHDKKMQVPENICTKWVDYDKIKHILVLRGRQSGDYMIINGHRKKIGRVMIDDHMPREERETAVLAADGSCILCILGSRRLSDSYRVEEDTERVLEIRLEPAETGEENGI